MRYTAWNIDRSKRCATVKSLLSNTCYTTWYINRGKSATIGKSFLSNTRYTIWNIDRCKSATIFVFTTDYYSIFYR